MCVMKWVTAAISGTGFAIDATSPTQVRSRNENHYIVYQLPYTPSSGAGEGVLRPTIQIELTYAELQHPAAMLPVRSLLAEAFGRPSEVPAIACVSLVQTAAEKLVSLTRRTAMELAGLSRALDPNLERHIHDLHVVSAHIDRAEAIDLARSIAHSDAQEFGNQYPAYLADIAGETHKALDTLQTDPAVRARYDAFVAAMVYGDPVAFDMAMQTVSALVNAAWPVTPDG